jgi:hypothetical protein
MGVRPDPVVLTPLMLGGIFGANHPFTAVAVRVGLEVVSCTAEPSTILLPPVNGMYLGWKGKLPEAGERLSIGVFANMVVKAASVN